MMAKILLGITTYSGKQYILKKFCDSLRKIYGSYVTCTDSELDILFVDNSETADYSNIIAAEGFKCIRSRPLEVEQERLTEAYNVLRAAFLRGNYTHLMILEQDVIAPMDIIQRLLQHDKPVTSGYYYIGPKDLRNPCVMIGSVQDIPKEKQKEFMYANKVFKYDFIKKEKLTGNKLIQVFACGLGCCLIKREVLEKIKFRARKNIKGKWKGHNDMFFYMDLRQQGIDVFVDPTLKCQHHDSRY